MNKPGIRGFKVLGFAVALLASPTTQAVDGVILIDQNRALAGSVTPGDTGGFPVTITQPGSYRLSSNLIMPNANTTAIEINADHVTIDLNGFAILGPVDCSGNIFACAGSGIGVGIRTVGDFPRFNLTVRNGTIQGMGTDGIRLTGDGNRVEYMHVRSNGASGIRLVASADLNGSAVEHCTVQRNGEHGIYLDRGIVSYNNVDVSAKVGIVLIQTGSVLYNVVTRNDQALEISSRASYLGNVFNENNVLGAGGSGSGVNLGQNLCNGAVCPGAQF